MNNDLIIEKLEAENAALRERVQEAQASAKRWESEHASVLDLLSPYTKDHVKEVVELKSKLTAAQARADAAEAACAEIKTQLTNVRAEVANDAFSMLKMALDGAISFCDGQIATEKLSGNTFKEQLAHSEKAAFLSIESWINRTAPTIGATVSAKLAAGVKCKEALDKALGWMPEDPYKAPEEVVQITIPVTTIRLSKDALQAATDAKL